MNSVENLWVTIPYNLSCTKYIRGELVITNKLYRFRAILKAREDLFIYLEKPVLIDNMELSSIDSQNRVKVLFTIEASDEKKAMIKARRFLESLCTAILLDTNIATDIENIDIVEAYTIHKSNSEAVKSIEIHEFVKVEAKVSAGLGLSESHIRNIVESARKVEGFDEEIIRLLRWYRRALLEDDLIDKFIHLWMAFEIWAKYKGYKKGEESEKNKMVRALASECGFSEKEANEIYRIRCSLFHSGIYYEALNKLQQLEKCFATIVSKIKQGFY